MTTGKLTLVVCLAAVGLFGQTKVSFDLIKHAEAVMDQRLVSVIEEDPVKLLGGSRGVFLDGYGVVLTSEIDLAPSAAPNPFRPAYDKGEVILLKRKKQHRIGLVKTSMYNMMVDLAWSLKTLPAENAITVAITIPYYRFEDIAGMPRQIVISAPKKSLLVQKGESVEKLVRTEEYF